jgi:hypothetical protein
VFRAEITFVINDLPWDARGCSVSAELGDRGLGVLTLSLLKSYIYMELLVKPEILTSSI